MTVAELGDRMSRAEFTRWIAFYKHEARERERANREAQRAAKRGRGRG